MHVCVCEYVCVYVCNCLCSICVTEQPKAVRFNPISAARTYGTGESLVPARTMYRCMHACYVCILVSVLLCVPKSLCV